MLDKDRLEPIAWVSETETIRVSATFVSTSVALAAVHSKAVALLLLTCCFLVLPLWESVIVLCFVVRHFMSILVL